MHLGFWQHKNAVCNFPCFMWVKQNVFFLNLVNKKKMFYLMSQTISWKGSRTCCSARHPTRLDLFRRVINCMPSYNFTKWPDVIFDGFCLKTFKSVLLPTQTNPNNDLNTPFLMSWSFFATYLIGNMHFNYFGWI